MKEQLYRKEETANGVCFVPVEATPPELTHEELLKLPTDTPVIYRDDAIENFGFFALYMPSKEHPVSIFHSKCKQETALYTSTWERCRLATQQEINENE